MTKLENDKTGMYAVNTSNYASLPFRLILDTLILNLMGNEMTPAIILKLAGTTERKYDTERI